MCGIYGAVSFRGHPIGCPEVLERMGAALRHRGPDAHALCRTPNVGLGAERLRIIDCHERADQPFTDPEGHAWLACNGEIYNAAALRRRFAGYPFRSRSDVEAVLPLYLAQGVDGIAEIDGMFGLAIWDGAERRLILARDRAGEKPLFYAWIGEEVWFASEIQALLEHPEMGREVDEIGLDQFLGLGYVLEPRTLFARVRRVEAGTTLTFGAHGETARRYWNPSAIAVEPVLAGTAVQRLQELLEAAVRKQLTADVPVGVFTSGGLDSSLLTALTTRLLGPDTVHTFTARFRAATYDESAWARHSVATQGTRHIEVWCDEDSLGEALRALTAAMAEPLADPAILPTYLLARAARDHVRVVLSGEGADELFGGYPTYLGHRLAPWFASLPRPLRLAIRRGVERRRASPHRVPWEFLLKRFVAAAERPWVERHLAWLGTGLAPANDLRAGWMRPLVSEYEHLPPMPGAMLLDYRSYLRDSLLIKLDRATMLNSIEARAPFLDRDVTAFALSLPSSLRVRGAATKWILKQAAAKWVPREIIRRRKRGLSVPVARWLNGGLRGEVDRLLEPIRLRDQGLVDAPTVSRLLAEHRSGRVNHVRALWPIVILQLWLERWSPKTERLTADWG